MHNAADSTSSSSHTSSPISTDEKFDALLAEGAGVETAGKAQEPEVKSDDATKVQSEVVEATSESTTTPSDVANIADASVPDAIVL